MDKEDIIRQINNVDTINQVNKISKKLHRCNPLKSRDEDRIIDLLNELHNASMTLDVLIVSNIGIILHNFRKKSKNEDIKNAIKKLLKGWKKLLPKQFETKDHLTHQEEEENEMQDEMQNENEYVEDNIMHVDEEISENLQQSTSTLLNFFSEKNNENSIKTRKFHGNSYLSDIQKTKQNVNGNKIRSNIVARSSHVQKPYEKMVQRINNNHIERNIQTIHDILSPIHVSNGRIPLKEREIGQVFIQQRTTSKISDLNRNESYTSTRVPNTSGNGSVVINNGTINSNLLQQNILSMIRPPYVPIEDDYNLSHSVRHARIKCRKLLIDALLYGEMSENIDCDPERIGSEIEANIYKELKSVDIKKYKNRVRSRVINLKDKNNQKFLFDVLTGILKPEKVASMTAEEMASNELKEHRLKIEKEYQAERVLIQNVQQMI